MGIASKGAWVWGLFHTGGLAPAVASLVCSLLFGLGFSSWIQSSSPVDQPALNQNPRPAEQVLTGLVTLIYASPLVYQRSTNKQAAPWLKQLHMLYPGRVCSSTHLMGEPGWGFVALNLGLWLVFGGSAVFAFAPGVALCSVLMRGACCTGVLPGRESWAGQPGAEHQLNHAVNIAFVLGTGSVNMMGELPSARVVALMLLCCVVSSLILNQWSEVTRTGCRHHAAVKGYVDDVSYLKPTASSMGRVKLAAVALNDALDQELVWRGLFLTHLMRSGFDPASANLIQAISFGAAQWHGIPSGWSGMGMALVYGWVLGTVVITLNGLAVAVVVHWVADYFIFTIIATKRFNDLHPVSEEANHLE